MPTNPTRDEAVAFASVMMVEQFNRIREDGNWDSWADVWLRKHEPYTEPLYSAATVTALEARAELAADYERQRDEAIEKAVRMTIRADAAEADARKFRRLAQLLDGFDFRLGRNELMMPATYLDSVEITCEFQPGIGQSVIDAIVDTLTGAGAK